MFSICSQINLSYRVRIEEFVTAADPDKEKNITFGNCNAFQRKLIYQIVEKDYADTITATSQVKNNQKVLVVERKWSAEKQMADVEKRNDEDENEYHRLVGLSAILYKISKSVRILSYLLQPIFHGPHLNKTKRTIFFFLHTQKKLIVGHNMFMDIFYLVRQFFEPLADNLKKFKKQAHKIFPKQATFLITFYSILKLQNKLNYFLFPVK